MFMYSQNLSLFTLAAFQNSATLFGSEAPRTLKKPGTWAWLFHSHEGEQLLAAASFYFGGVSLLLLDVIMHAMLWQREEK